MEKRVWQDLYHNLEQPPLGRTLVGFNVNIDRIIQVTRDLLTSLPHVHGEISIFRDRLYRSMQTCTADELFVRDGSQYRQFIRHFRGDSALGGQAGIAAVQLASAGAPEVICIAPSMGRTTRAMLHKAGVTITGPAPDPAERDTVHLVFEHSPGLVPVNEGTVPRNNRFIVSPLHKASSVILNDDAQKEFRNAASVCTRAFLSGYQYLTSDAEFQRAADQIHEAKTQNPDLKIHAEWVTVADPVISRQFIRYILPHIDSLGLNERELELLYHCLKPPASEDTGQTIRSPGVLAHQALELCRATGLVRLHLHTYGYYIVICKDCAHPEKTRGALLFASRTAVHSAGGMIPAIVPEGIAALQDVAGVFGRKILPGIFHAGDYQVIVIPSLIAQGITKSAGMGDRISSLAFAADPF